MSKKIEISREALLAAANQLSNWGKTVMAAPLWEALAAPAVERQEPVVIDLDAVDWETIQKAADESNWIPNEYMRNEWVADVCNFLKYGRADTSPPAPVAVLLPEPMPITEGMNRLMEAYRIGEFKLEGGSPTVEAMSCASYDNNPIAVQGHDFDSYASGYQAAMYEEAKSLLGLIACLDKVKEMNQCS